jgi:dipeptidyl aminopeptidase/acylaminoacyl peptidase
MGPCRLAFALALLARLSAAEAPPVPKPTPPPPGTDIFLFGTSLEGGRLKLGPPQRVTSEEGYDNQPSFSSDGASLYFASIRKGQADIKRYDLTTKEIGTVTETPESEFSPTPAPGGGLSVVRVEADGTQRLWRITPAGGFELLLKDVKPVGYHAWADPDTLVLFVLGDPPTLQVADVRSGKSVVVSKDPGRCLRPIPGRHSVAFVEKVSKGEWWLSELSFPDRKIARLARMPYGVEDYALLPDGRVVVGDGARLLELSPGAKAFREVVRFREPFLQGITRLASSPKGDLLAVVADEAPPFPLTVASIMRGPELVGYPPTNLRWSGDSKDLYFEWRMPGEDEPATWTVPRDGGEPRRLSESERPLAPGPNCEWDETRRLCLFEERGDVFLVDTVARTGRRVTRTSGAESSPHFTQHGTGATFVHDNNLFRTSLAPDGDLFVQLTETGPKKKDPKLTESQQFVKDEERKLLAHVDEAAARKKREEDRKEKEAPAKVTTGEKDKLQDGRLSDDSRYAFLVVGRRDEKARSAEVPNYVTESSYSELISARPYAGDGAEGQRLGILNLESRKTAWAFVEGVTSPEAEKEEPEGSKAEKTDKPKADQPKPRELRWTLPLPSPQGSRFVSGVRAVDNKDRWLVLVDPGTGRSTVLDHQHDDAWVRENAVSSFGWLDESRVWFLSEASGFQHLYTVDVTATPSAPKALTSGRWEVTDVRLAKDRQKFYLTTNEADAGERHLYTLPASGGSLSRLTREKGAHLVDVSPDGATLAEVYSAGNTPPEVYLSHPGSLGRQVTTSTRPPFRTYPWVDPRVVTFVARDGYVVPARLFTPEDVGAKSDPLAPGVVFVHGAGYLQNAHHYWSLNYYREYMFHHLLASRGYVVLDLDYRGSSGYGRDVRTAIAGHMGGKDLDDVVDGARFLVEKHGVNPQHLGVYGGSYGGFLTLMAMFTSPGTFASGAALRPVTDWSHYNHPYTSNILGDPPKDAEAYRRSSPIYFAQGLQGSLLICHGMVDTNVLFQDSVRLAQRLIELHKTGWELAPYPVENHAFEEASSWTDEYTRILGLFERTLRGKAQ